MLSSSATPAAMDIPLSSGSYGQMSEIIRAKERELQQIQDMRNAQLEAMILERDKLLLESSKRYEQLKEDFQYNLTLIEARDQEIERLESSAQQSERVCEELQLQVRTLSARLDALQQKEVERLQKMDSDKQNNKKIFEELKTVIESLQWTADEDAKAKQFEIDKCKKEIALLYRNKEEALELQRRDLTNTFEQIMAQREESAQRKEEEISKQITLLDQKFEKLQTENLKLKEVSRETKLRFERLQEESALKEDQLRQLQYQLEDEQQKKSCTEDALTREINVLQVELQRLTDLRSREKVEWESALEQVKGELLREREFRASVEKRLEERQSNADAEALSLQSEISALQRKIAASQGDFTQIQAEREQLLSKLASKRVESDSMASRHALLAEENEQLEERLAATQREIVSLETSLSVARREATEAKTQAEQQCKSLAEDFEQRLRTLQEAQQRQREREKTEQEQAREKLLQEMNVTQRVRLVEQEEAKNKEIAALRVSLSSKEQELSSLKESVEEKERLRREEKIETDALRLRIKAQEQQLLEVQQELRFLKQQQQALPSQSNVRRGGPPLPQNGTTAALGMPLNVDVSLPDLSIDVPASPLVSADFPGGTFSLPASPLISYTPQLPSHYLQPQGRAPLPSVPEHPDSVSSASAASYFGADKMTDHSTQLVLEENERLKKIIKEMRQDIENLRSNELKSTPSRDESRKINDNGQQQATSESAKKDVDVRQLQDCLEQSKEEILRLRSERKKLMDTGNELRSQLLQIKTESVDKTRDILEEMREQNVQRVYSWIQDDGEDDIDERSWREDEHSFFETPANARSRNVWDDEPMPRHASPSRSTQRSRPSERSAERTYQDFSSSAPRERPTTAPLVRDRDRDIEIRGESFKQSGRLIRSRIVSEKIPRPQAPETVKVAVSSSYARAGQGRAVLPTSNTHRGTSSQAQALQRLKDAKFGRGGSSADVSSAAESDIPPRRTGINYAALAKLESEKTAL